MSIRSRVPAAFAAAALAASALACGGKGGGHKVICLTTYNITTTLPNECDIYPNLNEGDVAGISSICTNANGGAITSTLVSSCPDAGLSGCCSYGVAAGNEFGDESCYYGGDPAQEQASCEAADAGTGAGIWSSSF